MTPTQERAKLYKDNGFDEHQIKKFNKDLNGNLEKLAGLYNVEMTGNQIAIGNRILAKYFENQRAEVERFKQREKLFNQHRSKFFQFFGRSLQDFWNNRLGLDILRLDDQIVQSGDNSMSETIKERYGEEAAELVRELVNA